MNRPNLNSTLTPTEFKAHRWLKIELVDFCAAHGLSTDGNKHALRRRVVDYLTDRQRLNDLHPMP